MTLRMTADGRNVGCGYTKMTDLSRKFATSIEHSRFFAFFQL
jgi:hypothetical protein